jgi:hypothetical protein
MAAIFKPLAFFFLGHSFEFSGLKIGHLATVRTFIWKSFSKKKLEPISLAVPSHLLTVESDERQARDLFVQGCGSGRIHSGTWPDNYMEPTDLGPNRKPAPNKPLDLKHQLYFQQFRILFTKYLG